MITAKRDSFDEISFKSNSLNAERSPPKSLLIELFLTSLILCRIFSSFSSRIILSKSFIKLIAKLFWLSVSKNPAKFRDVVAKILMSVDKEKYKTLESAQKAAAGFYKGIQKGNQEGFYDSGTVSRLIADAMAGIKSKSNIIKINFLDIEGNLDIDFTKISFIISK